MLLKEETNKYLNYCKFQKELDDKTIKAYKADLEQFITVIGENNPDKEVLNAYLVYLHRMYKQKTVKRKIASVKALFHYLEEEELIEINPFHKVKTKFREEVILPKIIPRDIIEQLLNHLYKERSIKEYSEWRVELWKQKTLRGIRARDLPFGSFGYINTYAKKKEPPLARETALFPSHLPEARGDARGGFIGRHRAGVEVEIIAVWRAPGTPGVALVVFAALLVHLADETHGLIARELFLRHLALDAVLVRRGDKDL